MDAHVSQKLYYIDELESGERDQALTRLWRQDGQRWFLSNGFLNSVAECESEPSDRRRYELSRSVRTVNADPACLQAISGARRLVTDWLNDRFVGILQDAVNAPVASERSSPPAFPLLQRMTEDTRTLFIPYLWEQRNDLFRQRMASLTGFLHPGEQDDHQVEPGLHDQLCEEHKLLHDGLSGYFVLKLRESAPKQGEAEPDPCWGWPYLSALTEFGYGQGDSRDYGRYAKALWGGGSDLFCQRLNYLAERRTPQNEGKPDDARMQAWNSEYKTLLGFCVRNSIETCEWDRPPELDTGNLSELSRKCYWTSLKISGLSDGLLRELLASFHEEAGALLTLRLAYLHFLCRDKTRISMDFTTPDGDGIRLDCDSGFVQSLLKESERLLGLVRKAEGPTDPLTPAAQDLASILGEPKATLRKSHPGGYTAQQAKVLQYAVACYVLRRDKCVCQNGRPKAAAILREMTVLARDGLWPAGVELPEDTERWEKTISTLFSVARKKVKEQEPGDDKGKDRP